MMVAYLLLAVASWLLLAIYLMGSLKDKNRALQRLANPARPPKRPRV